ncbi:exodeoxyribonuclease VII small subunit [Lapillicoccus sp.]|uniref:exodeoxyribonuclease VII small subunit n=1 Tax=Lapillicoccus sp. TaxID=1909287 RepID=UPI0025F81D03|nr:exodeoxyribonuclease VII small subunit [Lapillicoccus sp.]
MSPAAKKPAASEDSAVPDPGEAVPANSDIHAFPDIAGLSYEEARDELVAIVGGLENGQVPLEESMALWRRGEALAAHCTAWLDGAQRQIAEATGPGQTPGVSGPRPA